MVRKFPYSFYPYNHLHPSPTFHLRPRPLAHAQLTHICHSKPPSTQEDSSPSTAASPSALMGWGLGWGRGDYGTTGSGYGMHMGLVRAKCPLIVEVCGEGGTKGGLYASSCSLITPSSLYTQACGVLIVHVMVMQICPYCLLKWGSDSSVLRSASIHRLLEQAPPPPSPLAWTWGSRANNLHPIASHMEGGRQQARGGYTLHPSPSHDIVELVVVCLLLQPYICADREVEGLV